MTSRSSIRCSALAPPVTPPMVTCHPGSAADAAVGMATALCRVMPAATTVTASDANVNETST